MRRLHRYLRPALRHRVSGAGRPASVALLLPLSGKHRASGVAIRDGFMAAWLAEPADLRPQVVVYDTGTDAAGTYMRAVAAGARFVVGPLLKEELAAVASTQQVPVPTLALNALSGGQAPSFLYQFALDPVDEARAAARRIALDGYTRGVALFPANAWGKRLSEAFATELAARQRHVDRDAALRCRGARFLRSAARSARTIRRRGRSRRGQQARCGEP